ncbi:hypothetical protein IHE45_08G052700 [Dioscorea alata]|uniref:Uncharacterized protein n=1 Tax=Dioscorea alata TaxID=55571 RepID=A0ACB7VJA9_DIOAL|nr:hypothetical protein IHE45_08G052700 [Dioscorea alata]
MAGFTYSLILAVILLIFLLATTAAAATKANTILSPAPSPLAGTTAEPMVSLLAICGSILLSFIAAPLI